jgi:hypothetical protein
LLLLDKSILKQRSKRRKPLLLYFPDHNHRIFLGAYRSIILAQRWDEKIDSMERLALVCEHLSEIPMIWRSIVAIEIYSVYLFPVIVLLVNFEEDKDNAINRYSLSTTRKEQVSNFFKVSISSLNFNSVFFSLFLQLLAIMGEKILLESFIRLTVEILNYVLEISSNETISNELLTQSTSYKDNNSASNAANTKEKDENNTIIYDLQEIRNYYQMLYLSDDFLTNNEEIFKEEEFSSVWPRKFDMKLLLLHYEYYFHSQQYTNARNNTHAKSTGDPSPMIANRKEINELYTSMGTTPANVLTSSTNSSSSSRRMISKGYFIWNNKYQVFYHISVLYVLQLRFYCGLRGLKPSLLLGSNLLTLINEEYSFDYYQQVLNIDWKKLRTNRFYDSSMVNVRLEFLEQCFIRADSVATFSIKIIYHLAKLWDFENDIVHLLHLKSLLMKADIDSEMEGILSKVVAFFLSTFFLRFTFFC